jgi:hypothetical protein
MPDSIIINIVVRSFFPPAEPKPGFSEVVVLTAWNTFQILNRIKLVTRAFTIMDKMILVRSTGPPQGRLLSIPCETYVEPILVNQVARGNQLKFASEIRMVDGPKNKNDKIAGINMTRILLLHTIQQR